MVHISKIVLWSPNSHAGLSPVCRTHCVLSSILHLVTATICDPQSPAFCIAIRMVGGHSTASSSVMLRWGNLSPELKERCLLFSHHFPFILLINHLVFHQWWEEMENHFLPASWASRRSSSHRAGQTKIPSGDPLLNPCPPTAERSASPSAPYNCAHFFWSIRKPPSNPHSNLPQCPFCQVLLWNCIHDLPWAGTGL